MRHKSDIKIYKCISKIVDDVQHCDCLVTYYKELHLSGKQ